MRHTSAPGMRLVQQLSETPSLPCCALFVASISAAFSSQSNLGSIVPNTSMYKICSGICSVKYKTRRSSATRHLRFYRVPSQWLTEKRPFSLIEDTWLPVERDSARIAMARMQRKDKNPITYDFSNPSVVCGAPAAHQSTQAAYAVRETLDAGIQSLTVRLESRHINLCRCE